MPIITTKRLTISELTLADAQFIFELLNTEGWLQFIGDRGIHSLEDAQNYLKNGPMVSYQANGFGLWLVTHTDSQSPIGMCGLLKRSQFDDIDIGYAFLPQHQRFGYASEAAEATLAYAQSALQLKKLVAYVLPNNHLSIRLLEKIGLQFERMFVFREGEAESALYSLIL